MVAGLQIIPNAVLFEVPIVSAGAGKKNFFPDVPEIRGRKVTGFAVFSTSIIGRAPSSRPNITQVGMTRTYVSLIDQNNNVFVDQLPANFFNLLEFGQPLRNITPARPLKTQSCFFQYTEGGITGEVITCAFFYE